MRFTELADISVYIYLLTILLSKTCMAAADAAAAAVREWNIEEMLV